MRHLHRVFLATGLLCAAGLDQALADGATLFAAAPSPNVTVRLMNNRNVPIYVAFTIDNQDQIPGPISWFTGCQDSGQTAHAAYARIDAGTTCTATVDPNSFPENGLLTGSSRFCARVGSDATSAPDNCMEAQQDFLTMIETTFQPYVAPDSQGKNGQCFSGRSCVWYDISVIPDSLTGPTHKCTDATWEKDRCAKAGPASYNLPVQLSCRAEPTYTCQGPRNRTHGKPNYPSNCGNPDGKCNGSRPECVNAYFYPIFAPKIKPKPNSVCPNGKPLVVHFLAGP